MTNDKQAKVSSMIGLKDMRSEQTEYFRLYKDAELGLNEVFQQELKELV